MLKNQQSFSLEKVSVKKTQESAGTLQIMYDAVA